MEHFRWLRLCRAAFTARLSLDISRLANHTIGEFAQLTP